METGLGTLPQRHDRGTVRQRPHGGHYEMWQDAGVLANWLMPEMRKRLFTAWWPCWGVRGGVWECVTKGPGRRIRLSPYDNGHVVVERTPQREGGSRWGVSMVELCPPLVPACRQNCKDPVYSVPYFPSFTERLSVPRS
jgi:hypothetical protein